MTTVIGMDCGASHSTLKIWTDGKVILERHDLLGVNLDLLVSNATREYFVNEFRDLITYGEAYWVVGMAGLDSPSEVLEAENWLRDILGSTIPYADLSVMSDIELVLWAGSEQGQGIALIAGTGSNCLGRNHVGEIKKVGGMSHLMSDEGSGFFLGWKCLHLVTCMDDGRSEKTTLFDEVLKKFGVKSVVDLKNYLLKQENQKIEIAKAAELVLTAAERDEDEAKRIATEESLELVRMVSTVNDFFLDAKLPLYAAGGMFKNDGYRNLFVKNMHDYFPTQKVITVSPIEGALKYHRYMEK